MIDRHTENLDSIYASFRDPEFVKEHGISVKDGRITRYIVRTTIETKKLGEILLTSSCADGSEGKSAVPCLHLSKEQFLTILRTIPSVRPEARRAKVGSTGDYAYNLSEKNFEKIVSL